MVVKAQHRELEAAGSIASGVRKHRQVNTGAHLVLSLCLVCDSSPWDCATHIQGGSSLYSETLLVMPSWIHPQVYFHGNSKLVTLAMKTNPHAFPWSFVDS